MRVLLGPRPRPGRAAFGSRVKGSQAGALTGLQFPSNGQSPNAFVAFRFTGSNLLPIYPATYIWRLYPFQQNGYYTTFFWGNNGAFWWDNGSPNTYYGAHPYPDVPPSGSTHKWEIAVDGGDFTTDMNGNNTTVVKNQWYTQALVCWNTGSAKRHDFYWDLGTSSSRIIRHDAAASYGNTNPPSPALTFGDAPWAPQEERLSGILGAVKIFNTNLSLSDILSEAGDMSAIVTSAGAAARWWFKPTYSSVDDLTDPVTGRSAAWADSNNKATLVTI